MKGWKIASILTRWAFFASLLCCLLDLFIGFELELCSQDQPGQSNCLFQVGRSTYPGSENKFAGCAQETDRARSVRSFESWRAGLAVLCFYHASVVNTWLEIDRIPSFVRIIESRRCEAWFTSLHCYFGSPTFPSDLVGFVSLDNPLKPFQ